MPLAAAALPLVAGNIGATLGGAGSLIGGITSAFGASKQLSQSDQAARQYESTMNIYKNQLKRGPGWQKYGLEAAGYNPMLPFMSGGSAALPGTHGSVQQPQYQNRYEGLGSAISDMSSSAMDVMESLSRTEKLNNESQKVLAETTNIFANTKLTTQQTIRAVADTAKAQFDAQLAEWKLAMAPNEFRMLELQIKNAGLKNIYASYQNSIAKLTAKALALDIPRREAAYWVWKSGAGEILSWLNAANQATSGKATNLILEGAGTLATPWKR